MKRLLSRRARVIKGVIRTPDKSGLEHYKGGPLRWREMHTLEYTDPVFSKEQQPVAYEKNRSIISLNSIITLHLMKHNN